MNKAAAELNTVQSNVSTRLRNLESELGVALLRRHARGVAATPAGQRVLPFANRLVKLVADTRAAAIDEGSPGGALLMGALETTTALRLSPVLNEYTRRFPSVRLVLNTGTTAKLVQNVIDSKLEGAFVAGPVSHPDLAQEAIFTEEMVLVTSPSIRSPTELAELADLRMVVFQSGCSYRQRLESYLASQGVVVARPLEFGALDAVISCVSAGVGITLLPKGIVREHAKAGKVNLDTLPDNQRLVQTLFIRRKDGYPTSALKAFLGLARQHYETQKTLPDHVSHPLFMNPSPRAPAMSETGRPSHPRPSHPERKCNNCATADEDR